MTVRELIKHLMSCNPDLQVAYALHSEYTLMDAEEIETRELCEERKDGWLARPRPDKPTKVYLVFPGN